MKKRLNMFKKEIIIGAVLCLFGILSFNSTAVAGVILYSYDSTSSADSVVTWGWNPEENGSWNNYQWQNPAWWNSIEIIDNETYWGVLVYLRHNFALHPGENTPGNVILQSFTFPKDSYGVVVDASGAGLHGGETDHPEIWSFKFDRSMSPENTVITLSGTHAPEPISSILFVTGAATLGFRHFWKKKKTM